MVSIQTVTTSKKMRILFFPLAFLLITVSLSFIAYAQHSEACPVAAYEGDLIQLRPEAFDPDPEIGPAGRLLWAFGPPFDIYGRWQTLKGQRGIFNFWVSVSDGELKDTKHACAELFPNNLNPVLDPVPEVFVTRGENARIDATCVDPDGDPVEISFRFNGKDVAYIQYEPPGVYNVDVTCTDGFGGVDSERTKLHILMPEVQEIPRPKPAPVVISEPAPVVVEPSVVEVVPPAPSVVEVALPQPAKPDVLEVHYPAECPPCPASSPAGEIDVVVYDSIYPVDTTKADSAVFVVEDAKPVHAPAPAPPVLKKAEPVVISGCDKDKARKDEVDVVMGCC
ncbi:MAG: PKD domain-containing protein [Nanoarchaeota archaeon]|nr:PKD domain-containing protein [Nanoarchaeota archaeon]